MPAPDFNLLITLDILLAERSVVRAARRLGLSPSAMSRALARLRETMGDPLLVRAGRGLVPSPRAEELRLQVAQLVQDCQSVLRPSQKLDPGQLVRTFTIRSSEGFVENFGPAIMAVLHNEAPGVRLRFLPKPNKDSAPLRDGTVDLETGVVAANTAPEIRAQALFRDRFIGVVRKGHPLGKGRMTAKKYASAGHICVSRQTLDTGTSEEERPVDEALSRLGLQRRVATLVGGFSTAVALARATDLVASVPQQHTGALRVGMHSFPLPFATPQFTVSLLWHPRLDADPAHRWLRDRVQHAVAKVVGK